MPRAEVNGIQLSYERVGEGDPVVLVMGTGARGRLWHLHQVSALVDAGYEVVTFDNRGTPPSDVPPGPYAITDMVLDTAGLIEHLGLGRCRVAGFSLGALIAQELALARPDLVRAAVLIATRGRTDVARATLTRGAVKLLQDDVELPPDYDAATRAFQYLSPETLNDDRNVTDWLEIFAAFRSTGPGLLAQTELSLLPNRLAALTQVQVPCLVIGFQHDLLAPPALCREVADAIPSCGYVEITDCAHYGCFEKPDLVNEALIEFFRTAGSGSVPPGSAGSS
jgi:pimeloyl-ACP methyl ester carboxylesterase